MLMTFLLLGERSIPGRGRKLVYDSSVAWHDEELGERSIPGRGRKHRAFIAAFGGKNSENAQSPEGDGNAA